MLNRATVQEAVNAGRRSASAGALLGAAFLHDSRTQIEASSRRPLRLRRAPRWNQRALVFFHHQSRRTAPPPRPTKASAMFILRREANFCSRMRSRARATFCSALMSWSAKRAGTCSASFSTTWGRSRTTCTRATNSPSWSGHKGKPEAYYFPPQYNQLSNNFPHTYMGLEPGTTKEDIHRCLENWNRGDNGIIFHARAYRLEPGSGWQVDPGILHAPGSLVTYEPQVNSDVFAMFQSEVEGRIVDWSLLTKDVLPEYHHDLDYLISMLDWDANVNPEFAKSNKRHPVPVRPVKETEDAGYRELWITYGSAYYSAKELTVLPGRTVTIKDAAAYGLILTQGYGKLGGTAGFHAVHDPLRSTDRG